MFIDEIDKIARRQETHGADVSREGVQRDLLPLVEGSTVSTKHGMVKTDHILFIASGAFHMSKPSDLIPELQGRFPIRVELDALKVEDFIRILTEPDASLCTQYRALLETEGVHLEFADERRAPHRRSRVPGERAHREHRRAAPAHGARATAGSAVVRSRRPQWLQLTVDAEYVDKHLGELVKDEDLTRYILSWVRTSSPSPSTAQAISMLTHRHQARTKSRLLEVSFDDGARFELPFEYLRVYSPSAEVRGHGPGQETLQLGKHDVGIAPSSPSATTPCKLVFDDGHDTGLYTWAYLHELGRDRDAEMAAIPRTGCKELGIPTRRRPKKSV